MCVLYEKYELYVSLTKSYWLQNMFLYYKCWQDYRGYLCCFPAVKYEQTDGITLLNRTSLLPSKSRNRRLKNTGEKYYRPNR